MVRRHAVAHGLAFVAALAHDGFHGFGLLLGVWNAGDEQGARGIELAGAKGFAAFLAKVEQLQAGVNVAAAFADLGGHVVNRNRRFVNGLRLVHQLVIAFGFLERAEVFALQVFHQLNVEHFAVGQIADDGGNGGLACNFAGPVAPLTAHQLVDGARLEVGGVFQAAGGQRAHKNRRVNGKGIDALGQLGQLGMVEGFARVGEAGHDLIERGVGVLVGGVGGGHAVLQTRAWVSLISATR